MGSNCHGRNGKHLELKVPVGTVIFEVLEEGGDQVERADLTEAGQKVRIAAGGQGGRGNARFVTSTNRAPRRADPGMPGEGKRLRLQLKLLADVGLVGFPNAGKSTLISRISAARPKIADYPFTTLTPHLGVVALSDDRSFVVADVPGLIEGAHRGLGLGHQFLRHLERTRLLVHMIDVSGLSGRDPAEDFTTIQRELELYRPELAAKPALAAANKMDAVADAEVVDRLEAHLAPLGVRLHRISAVTGEGVAGLVEAMWRTLASAPEPAAPEPTAPAPVAEAGP
jgi:GTP-binding protein